MITTPSQPAGSDEEFVFSRSIATPPALSEGSAGEAVMDLQTALAGLGLFETKIDGVFGPITRRAVIKFQRSHQLKADGVVGPKTWADIIPD